MKVLFLEIAAERDWALAAIGPGFLAAYLRENGHEAAMLRVGLDDDEERILEGIRAHDPGLLALSLTTRQWQRGRQVVRQLREKLDIPVVTGGLHPTFSADAVLESPGFDYVCLGEGEEALLDLVRHIETRGRAVGDREIHNIQVRPGARPSLRPPFPDLDQMPWIARDLLNERHGVVYMATQRGCPFPCTYCAARKYDDLYEGIGDYGRRRSHGDVLEELFEIRRTGELNYVIFLDDTFTINRPWVREFCRIYGERLKVPFSLHARVETVTPDLLQQLAGAGCTQITYGVESGSERVRKDIMKRHVTNQRFIDVFNWTRDAGIHVTANFILGTPGETKDEVEQTLELCEALDCTDFGYFVFYPYPGTSLFKLCQDKGYLPEDYLDRQANHRETILRLPDLSQDDIRHYYDRFTMLRERLYAKRYGRSLAELAATGVSEDLRHSAAIG